MQKYSAFLHLGALNAPKDLSKCSSRQGTSSSYLYLKFRWLLLVWSKHFGSACNMDGYELAPSLFYFIPGTSVSLFKGCSRARNLPVVLKRHDFTLIQEKAQQMRMVQTINAALAQAKIQHPNSCDILEVQMEIEGLTALFTMCWKHWTLACSRTLRYADRPTDLMRSGNWGRC